MPVSPEDVFFEIHRGLPREAPGGEEHTLRAWSMLPPLDRPLVLDMGCGPGSSACVLAAHTGARVVGCDFHRPFLPEMLARADGGRVHAVHGSMFAPPFADGTFDVFWAEGSIYTAGWEPGLRMARGLVRPGGFLALSECCWLRPNPPAEIAAFWAGGYPGMTTVSRNLAVAERLGLISLGHFLLPPEAWLEAYYQPVGERIAVLRGQHAGDLDALAVLDAEEEEIRLYEKYHAWYGYVFFVFAAPG
jgi:SAM-dependent methyltransferase